MDLTRADFVPPNFSAPIDLAAQKRLVPRGATVKGMQLQGIVDECARRGAPLEGRRYVGFRDYSGEELLDLLVLAAERAWPKVPRREGLRRLGRVAYPTLRESMVGRVIFAAFGGDVKSVWSLVKKGYSLSASTGSAAAIEIGDHEVIVRFEGIYSFVDAWHVGIMEGAVQVYGLAPDVLVKTTGPMSADLWIRWEGDMDPAQLA
jgi:uncharacterized protein (TIGR02265 family)